MNVIPWRVRALISNRFPLAYHLAANALRQRRSESYWDERLAETWHLRSWPTKNDLIASLTNQDQLILDIACGNGSILKDLKHRGYQNLHGLELSNYAVERLSSEGFTMHHGTVTEMPIHDESYDVVIASQVLEHIIRRHKFAREINRILKPQGKAFIFVPNNCLGPIDEPEHVIQYNHDSLRKFLAAHFRVGSLQVIRDANYPMTILFAEIRKQ